MKSAAECRRQLAALGAARQTAREQVASTTKALRAVVRQAIDDGIPEAEVARLAQLGRMTVREWLGKR